jgi:hypothetical protein
VPSTPLQILVRDNWGDTMSLAISSTGSVSSSVFFIAFVILASIMFTNLFIGIICAVFVRNAKISSKCVALVRSCPYHTVPKLLQGSCYMFCIISILTANLCDCMARLLIVAGIARSSSESWRRAASARCSCGTGSFPGFGRLPDSTGAHELWCRVASRRECPPFRLGSLV